jgi:hypothetical protein
MKPNPLVPEAANANDPILYSAEAGGKYSGEDVSVKGDEVVEDPP